MQRFLLVACLIFFDPKCGSTVFPQKVGKLLPDGVTLQKMVLFIITAIITSAAMKVEDICLMLLKE
jgi:hypothetical protein